MKVVLLLIAMLLATTQAAVRSTHHGGEMFACETVADHLDRGPITSGYSSLAS